MRTRPPVLALALGLALLPCLLTGSARGQSRAALPDGIAVVTDPVTLERTTSIAPGEMVDLWVVTDELAMPYWDELRTLQFAVEVDPRLEVIERDLLADALLITVPANDEEWVLGLNQCVNNTGQPLVLCRYRVRLPAGESSTADLSVRPVDLPVQGEPMLYGSCLEESLLRPLQDAGGSLLNASPGSLVHFGLAPTMVVEGRDYVLAWEFAPGTAGVELDGEPVAAQGRQERVATAGEAGTHTVVAGAVSESHELEIIRQPFVVDFGVDPIPGSDPARARMHWDVVGADELTITGQGNVFPRGSVGLELLLEGESWTLSATNEWGTTEATVTLGVGPDDPPFVVQWMADPNPFRYGGDPTLRWWILGADSVEILPGIGNVDPERGSLPVSLQGGAQYTLRATNANGTIERELVVDMAPPRVLEFAFDPPAVYPGEASQLSWVVDGASDVELLPTPGGGQPLVGSTSIVPASASEDWTLRATNPEGAEDSRAATIRWLKPDVGLLVDGGSPFPGDTITAHVELAGADAASLTPLGAIDPVDGSYQLVAGADSIRFHLVATNAAGQSTATRYAIPRAPFVALRSQWDEAGENRELVATVDGADWARIDPDIGDIPAAGGSFVLPPDTFGQYTLTAGNAVGESSASVWIVQTVPEVTLVADNQVPAPGDTVTLQWTIRYATTAELWPDVGAIDPPVDGSAKVVPLSSGYYTLTATNPLGSSTARVHVSPMRPSVSLAADPRTVFPGDSTTLHVSVERGDWARLEPGPGDIPPEPASYRVPVNAPDVNFKLTAGNAAGTRSDWETVRWKKPDVEWEFADGNFWGGDTLMVPITVAGADSIRLDPFPGRLPAPLDTTLALVLPGTPQTITFTLLAWNRAGLSSRSKGVQVLTPEPFFVYAGFFPAAVAPGEPSTLKWQVDRADTVWSEPPLVGLHPGQGELQLQISETTTYTLFASNEYGTGSREVTLGLVPYRLDRFELVDRWYDPVEGESAVLVEWEISGDGSATAELEGVGGVPLTGSYGTRISDRTTFALTASGLGSSQTWELEVEPVRGMEPWLHLGWQPDRTPGEMPDIQPFVPVSLYVLAELPAGHGLQGFEFALEHSPCLTVVEREVLSPVTHVDVGSGSDNWIVGLAACVDPDPLEPLLRYSFISTDPGCTSAASWSLGPASPSSVSPTQAALLDCLDQLLPARLCEELPMGSGAGTPALVLSLAATEADGGVRLAWSLEGSGRDPQSLAVYRRVDGGTPRRVAEPLPGARGWVDDDPPAGARVGWQLRAKVDGQALRSGWAELQRSNRPLPSRHRLLGNYPNPFNPRTTLRLQLAAGPATLAIHDLSGRRLRSFPIGGLSPGVHEVVWDGTDDAGRVVAAGVYLAVLEGAAGRDQRRLVLVK